MSGIIMAPSGEMDAPVDTPMSAHMCTGPDIFQACERDMHRSVEPAMDTELEHELAAYNRVLGHLRTLASLKERDAGYGEATRFALANNALKYASDVLPSGYNADFEVGYMHGLYIFCFPEELYGEMKHRRAMILKQHHLREEEDGTIVNAY
jgi:hypothetical protein